MLPLDVRHACVALTRRTSIESLGIAICSPWRFDSCSMLNAVEQTIKNVCYDKTGRALFLVTICQASPAFFRRAPFLRDAYSVKLKNEMYV
jgi:hypothetical protein